MRIKKIQIKLFPYILILISVYACRKEDIVGLPQIETLPITDVHSGFAKSGGKIISNGGKEIIFSGVAWSKTNNSPTIADDTTKSISQGSFIATLKNIDPSSTYYVRAYATTEIGVGYGDVMTITTENGRPEARDLTVVGSVLIDQTLSANYAYFDYENNTEGQTSYQWYFANDANGQGETAISGATTKTLVITDNLDKKFLRVSVLPMATSGTLSGIETKSVYVGPVGEATTVTFIYNSSTVTYNILTSPITGRKWLDRNLGALNAPNGIDDYSNFGDLFQWGRIADGHQLITRTGGTDANVTSKNGATAQLAQTDKPAHGLFITNNGYPDDWRFPFNNNLWQGVNGTNNPCPSGWRLPTETEWDAERITSLSIGFTNLKLTKTGYRFTYAGEFYSTDTYGTYWTSIISTGMPGTSQSLWIDASSSAFYPMGRGSGMACRCIKEQ